MKPTTKARNALSASQYPAPVKSQAKNALARVAQQVKAAPATASKIKAKAERKLGK